MKIFLIIFLFISGIFAQSLTIKSVKPLTDPEQGAFFHPVAGPNGEIVFSKASFKDLYYMDSAGKMRLLSDKNGAGYQPGFSADGHYVYFRSYIYDGLKKLSSLVKMSVADQQEQVLISNERHFSTAKMLSDGTIAVERNAALQVVDATQKNSAARSPLRAVFSEKGKIALYDNGTKKILTPAGDGFYLWPALSPDGSKVLFTLVGQGTFISDLKGNITAELGYANAPQWSPDGRWIAFMRDRDDGHQIKESDIFIISADGNNTLAVTQTADIKEIYPSWGVMNEIVFGSEAGIIYKARLDIP